MFISVLWLGYFYELFIPFVSSIGLLGIIYALSILDTMYYRNFVYKANLNIYLHCTMFPNSFTIIIYTTEFLKHRPLLLQLFQPCQNINFLCR